jgi:predicted nucleic acid-binding Zn ribbon protein
VAAESEPVSERAGVVTVACRSAVWAQELELLAPDLLARLNGRLESGRVTRLRFVVGRS